MTKHWLAKTGTGKLTGREYQENDVAKRQTGGSMLSE